MMSESDEQRLMHLRKGHDFVREGECNICFLLSVINERDASLAAVMRERNTFALWNKRHREQRDAAIGALEIIAGLEIPKHKLPDLEFCRATAVIAREQARAALQGKPTKKHFDVQPPGDDPQKIG